MRSSNSCFSVFKEVDSAFSALDLVGQGRSFLLQCEARAILLCFRAGPWLDTRSSFKIDSAFSASDRAAVPFPARGAHHPPLFPRWTHVLPIHAFPFSKLTASPLRRTGPLVPSSWAANRGSWRCCRCPWPWRRRCRSPPPSPRPASRLPPPPSSSSPYSSSSENTRSTWAKVTEARLECHVRFLSKAGLACGVAAVVVALCQRRPTSTSVSSVGEKEEK